MELRNFYKNNNSCNLLFYIQKYLSNELKLKQNKKLPTLFSSQKTKIIYSSNKDYIIYIYSNIESTQFSI